MEQIKTTVSQLMQDWQRKTSLGDKENPQVWLKKVLTKKELRHIKFNYFRKGILGIQVDSASWLYHFNLEKERLLTQLRSFSAQIKDLHWRIGEIK